MFVLVFVQTTYMRQICSIVWWDVKLAALCQPGVPLLRLSVSLLSVCLSVRGLVLKLVSAGLPLVCVSVAFFCFVSFEKNLCSYLHFAPLFFSIVFIISSLYFLHYVFAPSQKPQRNALTLTFLSFLALSNTSLMVPSNPFLNHSSLNPFITLQRPVILLCKSVTDFKWIVLFP